MIWKIIIQHLFFHKRERNGIIALLILILGCILLRASLPVLLEPDFNAEQFKKNKTIVDSLYALNEKDHLTLYQPNTPSSQSHPGNSVHTKVILPTKTFNPNSVTLAELKQMGLSEKLATTWIKFNRRQNAFKKTDDLKKIYGMTDAIYQQLAPYCNLESRTETPVYNNPQPTPFILKIKKKMDLNLNTCDSATLTELPGIGPSYARRIIAFRNKLGGFYSVNQLKEVYGIDSVLFNKIAGLVYTDKNIKQINLNNATLEELKAHPYIKWNLANNLVAIRNKQGNFTTVEDIKKSALITEELFNKVKPYLTY